MEIKRDLYYMSVAPVFDMLGWDRVTILSQDSKVVFVSGLRDKAGEMVDMALAEGLVDTIRGVLAAERGAESEAAPEPDDEVEEAEPAPEGVGPFELDYESITDSDRAFLKGYAMLQIAVSIKDMTEKVAEPFGARSWGYVGEHYGDGMFVFGLVRDEAAGRIVAPDVLTDALKTLGVEYEVSPTSEAAEPEAAERTGELSAVEGEGSEPPPLCVPAADLTSKFCHTVRMSAGESARISFSLEDDGPVQTRIGIDPHLTIVIISSAAQAVRLFAHAEWAGSALKAVVGKPAKETEQEDGNGKES